MENHEKVVVIRLATRPQKPICEYKRSGILLLGSLACIVTSFSYAWNLISTSMQKRYDLSQRDLSTIVTVGLVVQYCVLPYAFLYDFIGPLPISILATLYFPLGTLLLALCFMGKVEGTVVRLSVFNALMSTGCCVFDLAACVTVLSHFPSNRGAVTALLKTFTGLGSALASCLYTGFFNSDPEKHFFFLFAVGIVVGLLCVAFLRLPEYHLTQYQERTLSEEEKERRLATKAQYLRQEAPLRRFVWGFIVLIALIIFLPTEGALTSYLMLGRTPTLAFAIVTTILTFLFFFVAAPLKFLNSSYIPFFYPVHTRKWEEGEEEKASAPFSHRGSAEAEADAPAANHLRTRAPDELDDFGDMAAVVAAENGKETSSPCVGVPDEKEMRTSGDEESSLPMMETELDYLAPQYQGSFFHNLTSLEIWALWWTMFTVVGTEFVVIYNASFILAALKGSPVDASLSALLTVLNGVGSAVGRLLMSYFEVWSQKRKAEDRLPITIALFLPTSTIILTLVLFLVLPARALPLPYIVAALGNGFLAGVTLLVTRTIFAKDVAKHYNFCFTGTMLASLLFNRFLYGEWYTVQADKQARADKMCYGKKCVLMPLLVLLGLACSAFITDFILHLRYRSYCINTLAERARLREAMVRGETRDEESAVKVEASSAKE